MTAYFHVANGEELFGCNTLDLEVNKDWIAASLAEGDPILGKVFEAIEEGFDNRIILYSLNANEFRRLYRALRRQDDVAVEFGKSNSKTAYAAKVWFELMERLARDRRNSEWEE